MEVRVCPSCGTENKKSRSSCVNCYASLATVPATQSGGAQPSAPQPQQQGRTLSGAPVYKRPTPPAPQPPADSSPFREPEPASGSSAGPILMVVGILVAVAIVAFAGLKLRPFLQTAKAEPKVPADQVVMSFLDAKKTRDIEKVKPFLSEGSIMLLDKALSSKQAQSAGFTREDAHDMYLWGSHPAPEQLQKSTYTAAVVEDEKAETEGMRVVRVVLKLKEQPSDSSSSTPDISAIMGAMLTVPEVDFVLVQEGEEWKIDLRSTQRRTSKGPLLIPK